MDDELKGEWLARLRSGQYEQGRNYLCYVRADGSTSYCCLGVLAEAMVEKGLVSKNELRRPDFSVRVEYSFARVTEDEHPRTTDLPDEVVDDGHQDDLMRMNDTLGKTFSEIADWIEVNL